MTTPRPFNIRIFVAEGIPDGLRFVEKSNWVGLGVICPRARYPEVKKREEFSGSGVYILIGQDESDDRPMLYIGEAETVRTRLDSHHANKDFWQQAIVFTTKRDPLHKAQVQYLEACLVELATANKRCRLDNGNAPNRPGLSEMDEAEIAGYLAELLSLLPVLGIDAFERVDSTGKKHHLYYLKGKGCDAKGFQTNNGFAVQAGSFARADVTKSMEVHMQGSLKKRELLIADGILVPCDKGFRFEVDQEFSSSSLAASIVMGRSASGPGEWKDAKGVTFKENQQQEAQS